MMFVDNREDIDILQLNRSAKETLDRYALEQVPDIDLTTLVDDLLALEDVEFIEQAFEKILCREPDPTGLETYLQLLRQGEEPKLILSFLRYSTEGKQRFSEIPGLRFTFIRYKLCNTPIVGKCFTLLFSLFNILSNQQDLRKKLNINYRYTQKLQVEFTRLRDDHQELHDHVIRLQREISNIEA